MELCPGTYQGITQLSQPRISLQLSIFTTICLSCCLLTGSSFAQLRVLPANPAPAVHLKAAGTVTSKQTAASFRLADTQSLPFWDDFSYMAQRPDTLLWHTSSTASVTYGIAINPPSWGTVTLDGVKPDGTPYNTGGANTNGETDMLQSDSINLAAIADPASVFLSFYWQLQGAGERPDLRDRLRLYFLDDTKTWQEVWSQNGDAAIVSSLFQQHIISLKAAGDALGVNFLHPAFSFKFQSDSRQNGQFDQWHLDHIYLNEGRMANDIYYKDVAISSGFTSLLTPYTAMPYKQFWANPSAYLRPELPLTAFNADDPNAAENNDQAIYQVLVTSELDESIYTSEVITLTNSTPEGPVPIIGQQYITETVSGLSVEDLAPFAGRDSVILQATLDLNVQDGKPEYFRNNTLVVTNPLNDYYAYDDGSAEHAVSLNGRGQRLAYRYVLEDSALMSDISLYAPFYNRPTSGQEIKLLVFTALAGINGAAADVLRYSERVSLPPTQSGLNEFITFVLTSPPMMAPGEFYIGIEQLGTNATPIGFDANTNSREQVFQSINGTEWLTTFDLEGSLMLRPHFRPDATPVTGLDDHLFPPLRLYPNPANQQLWVESEAQHLRLYDAQGRLVLQKAAKPRTELQTGQLQPGLYLLQLHYKTNIQSKRILIIH